MRGAYPSSLCGLGQALVGLAEGAVDGRHENPALQVQHHYVAEHHPAAARRAVVVGGPEQGQFVHVGQDVLLVPDVVARRHNVNAGLQQGVGGFGGQAKPAGGVLGVGGHQVNIQFPAELGQQPGQGAAARLPDDVADH